MLQTYIFLGRSGCGKGTQAALLEKYLRDKNPNEEVLYLQTGELFRQFIKEESYTSKKVQEVLAEGGILPEFLPIWAWTSALIKYFKGNEHLIFDGVTRKLNEAPVLETALKFYGREKPHAILMNVSDEWATDKLLKRGRYDDTPEGIKQRLSWYESDALPAIIYYRNTPYFNYIEINGEQTIEDVHKEIISKLES